MMWSGWGPLAHYGVRLGVSSRVELSMLTAWRELRSPRSHGLGFFLQVGLTRAILGLHPVSQRISFSIFTLSHPGRLAYGGAYGGGLLAHGGGVGAYRVPPRWWGRCLRWWIACPRWWRNLSMVTERVGGRFVVALYASKHGCFERYVKNRKLITKSLFQSIHPFYYVAVLVQNCLQKVAVV